jgi:hypothetical protein
MDDGPSGEEENRSEVNAHAVPNTGLCAPAAIPRGTVQYKAAESALLRPLISRKTHGRAISRATEPLTKAVIIW